MNIDRHERVQDSLERYALGELSDDETRQVEDHLQTCAECAEQVRALQQVQVALADATALTPRPDLKRRVMAALVPGSPEASTIREQVPLRARRVSLWVASAAAAAVLVLTAGASWLLVRSEQRRTEDALRAALASTARLESRLQLYAGQTDRALAILTSADTREVALGAAGTAARQAARAYWSPTRGLLLVADDLPEPPPGRIYQVWVIAGSTPVSAGLLGEGRSRRGMLIVPPPRAGVTGAVTVAVTDEPPGGLAAPTGAIRLAGSL